MSTGETPHHPQLLALKSSLLATLATLQTHLTTNRDTHTQNMQALTTTHENLLYQARAAHAYAGGQQELLQFLHPASISASASALGGRLLNGPLREIATLIRHEVYASGRREEDTLAIIQALEWEVKTLEAVGEGREEKEEGGKEEEVVEVKEEENGYVMGFDGSSNSIGHIDGQGYEQGYGYGYPEGEGHVPFHQDIQFSEDLTYIWDGEGYRPMYNFGSEVVEEEAREQGESKGGW